MKINPTTDLLEDIIFQPSPNCDARPEGSKINLVVIHNISLPPGEFAGDGIHQLFTNTLDPEAHPYYREICHLKVSAHVLIRRSGEMIQYVPFHMRAWHAGESCYEGQNVCNNFSIGIELEGTDDQAYEDIQYERLAAVCKSLIRTYPEITKERITGHQDIAPDRKTDPGSAFDWDRFKRQLSN
jgi:AmpD protein